MNTKRSYVWLMLALLISVLSSINCLPPIMPYTEFGVIAGSGPYEYITMPDDTLAVSGAIQFSYPIERNVEATIWTVLEGQDGVVFEDDRALETKVIFPETGLYTLELKVNTRRVETGEVEIFSDELQVAVIPENGAFLALYRIPYHAGNSNCPTAYWLMEDEGFLKLTHTEDACVIALRDGAYSKTFRYQPSETIEVDLDPTMPGVFNGVIFLGCTSYADTREGVAVKYVGTQTVTYEFTTDEYGRFALALEPGEYDFALRTHEADYPLDSIGRAWSQTGYADFGVPICRVYRD